MKKWNNHHLRKLRFNKSGLNLGIRIQNMIGMTDIMTFQFTLKMTQNKIVRRSKDHRRNLSSSDIPLIIKSSRPIFNESRTIKSEKGWIGIRSVIYRIRTSGSHRPNSSLLKLKNRDHNRDIMRNLGDKESEFSHLIKK